jgi:hypothetical protein
VEIMMRANVELSHSPMNRRLEMEAALNPRAGRLLASALCLGIMIIQSPNEKYSVEQHDDYGEIRMGSPEFGHITIHGTEGQLPDRLYSRAVVVSLVKILRGVVIFFYQTRV